MPSSSSNALRDMEINPELDRYSSDMLDEEDYGAMSAAQRKAAERALASYDKEHQRHNRGLDLLR